MKVIQYVFLAGLICIAHVCATQIAPAQEKETAVRQALEHLMVARIEMAQKLGKDHPQLKQINLQIEILKKSLADMSALEEKKSTGQEIGKKMADLKDKLMALEIERQELLRRMGEKHPSVQQVSRQVEFYKAMLAELAAKDQHSDFHEKAIAQRDSVNSALLFLERASQDFQSISNEEKVLLEKINELVQLKKSLEAKNAILSLKSSQLAKERDMTDLSTRDLAEIRNATIRLRREEERIKAMEAELQNTHESQAEAMNRQLELAEQKLRDAQMKMVEKESKKAKSESIGQIESKLDKLQKRMGDMEAMLKKILTKLESKSGKN